TSGSGRSTPGASWSTAITARSSICSRRAMRSAARAGVSRSSTELLPDVVDERLVRPVPGVAVGVAGEEVLVEEHLGALVLGEHALAQHAAEHREVGLVEVALQVEALAADGGVEVGGRDRRAAVVHRRLAGPQQKLEELADDARRLDGGA